MPVASKLFALTAAIACLQAGPVHAGSLQVAPVLLEVHAQAGATSTVVKNPSAETMSAQVRVFRWQQTDGADRLVETRDVVASPPLFNVSPKSQQIVRLVRIEKRKPESEESYRVLVDEIPSAVGVQGRSVQFAMRYSLPLFFQPNGLLPPQLDWALDRNGKKLQITARNAGNLHIRISALRLEDSQGHRVSLGPGLVGYVLGQSEMTWGFTALRAHEFAGQNVLLSADTDQGPIKTSIILRDSR
jgi:fimbrial chaperone protein